MSKYKVVVIGGGNGSAISINALKQNKDLFDISAVVSMSDSGGSSGRLREEFDTLPPGDIMRAILAMSPHDYEMMKKIFYRIRFQGVEKLEKHNLGNLFLVLSEKYSGDYMAAVRSLEQSVEAIGKVYPVTLDKTDLVAELEDGQIIKTEAVIDRPDHKWNNKIKKVWLEPDGKILVDAKEEIEQADYIILGPGSLYCSVVATLLPKGVKEAMNNSKAKLVYVTGDAYELKGEIGAEKLSEFVIQLEKYLPRKLDLVIYNDTELSRAQKEFYKKKQWAIIEKDLENLSDHKLIGADYEKPEGKLCSVKLGKILKDLIIKK